MSWIININNIPNYHFKNYQISYFIIHLILLLKVKYINLKEYNQKYIDLYSQGFDFYNGFEKFHQINKEFYKKNLFY